MAELIALLVMLGYVVFGAVSFAAVSYIRNFDEKRRLHGGAHRQSTDYMDRRSSRGNFDDTYNTEAVVSAGLLGYFGLLIALYHLHRVEWSKEQRSLVKKLESELVESNAERLQEKLDQKRQDRINRLEELTQVNK